MRSAGFLRFRTLIPACLRWAVSVATLLVAVPLPLLAQQVAPGERRTPVQARTASAAAEREPIEWDHVYGTRRISIGTGAPFRPAWVSDSQYLTRGADGWNLVDARSGKSNPWYDATPLKTALAEVDGISPEDAEGMARGSWKHINHAARMVVFEHGNKLIRISLDGDQRAVVDDVPTGREVSSLSPTAAAVAFVRENDLWVADFETGKVRQLTFDGSEKIRNGKADWVYFEEVYHRRWDAYRWSPDGTKLLFQQFDDTEVPEFQVTNHTSVQPEIETESFPKAGETNPTVRLGIVSVSGGEVTWVDSGKYPSDDLIITHFNWLPDSRDIYWFAQNRIQTWLDVVRTSPDGSSRTLLRDQTQAWVDNPGDVTFLQDGSFLMFSERTGWKHLYQVSADGSHCQAVTAGDWEVRNLLAVSADQQSALVSGTLDSAIAENIYRISLVDAESSPVRLTPEDGHHSAACSPHGELFIDTFSSLNQPDASVVRDQAGSEIRRLREPSALPTDKYRFGTVELRDVPMSDGTTTAAIFVLPPDFDPTRKYPVWLMTYGGPHNPNVKNSFSSRLQEHLLANLGIITIRFDPRSASGYGAKSAWLAYRQLGVEETKDLVSLCTWLAQQPWADAERIGMSGHSYGGYYTSYAMTHCDRLCAGIAGAPVTDWANYDTIYTERFMSTPQENPDGYRKASVVRAAGDLHGRLLLLHGLMDDNVHPSNSIQLIHQLQRSNKQFEMMFYPTARHGISGGHYNKLVFNFIVTAMGRPDAARK